MGRPPRTVDVQLKSAQSDASIAAERLRRISAARLEQFLRLSTPELLAHLDDRALSRADRNFLRQSIRKEVVRSRRARLCAIVRRGMRAATQLLARGLLKLEIVAPSIIVVAWLVLAWNQSAHRAVLARPVLFSAPDQFGIPTNAVLPEGAMVIVRRGWDGVYRLRRWAPFEGYKTIDLPVDAIRLTP